jgi:hypothetical protein
MSTSHDQQPFTFNKREKSPHAGDLPVEQGGERPVREFDKTPLDKAPLDIQPHEVHDTSLLPEDFQASPPTFVPRGREAERLPVKRGRSTRAKITIGGAIVSGLAVAGTATGIALHSANNAERDIDAPLPDQNTSAPEVPGALDPPEWEAFEFPYEEAIKPAQLTDEQLAAWNSGDTQAQNEIVDQALRDRTSYALTDIQRTQGTGQTPDLSYVTHDPAVVESLNWVVSQLPEASEVNGISVCPLDASDYGFAQMCYPSHLDTPINFAPKPGDDVVIYVNVIDDENTFGVNPDLFEGFDLNIRPEVDSDGVMTWVPN